MPRQRDAGSPRVVYRSARAGLRLTRAQRRRLLGLPVSAGDVWCCVLELNAWRRARQATPLAGYQELCRELAASRPGTFGELDTTGARSVLRRYSDAWFAAAKRPWAGDVTARFPRRRRRMVPVRALHAECRQHLRDAKARHRAVAHRAPKPGQRGSRRWRKHRRRQRMAEACHARRIRQAQHEAARKVVAWAQQRKVGTLAVGDLRGVLALAAGRRHNQRTRAWRIGHLLRVLHDKAETAGIIVRLVDERGTSSTCPACGKRIPKPAGRVMSCPSCGLTGHRDLLAAANIAARTGGGTTPAALPAAVTHRRAGAHLPGVSPARRDPRRRAHPRSARGSPGRHRPALPSSPKARRGVARPTARSA